MRFNKQSLLPLLSLVAACSQAQPVVPAQPPAAQVAAHTAVVINAGLKGSRTAVLNIGLPRAPRYELQSNPTVHRWVVEDIKAYEIELRMRNASNTSQYDTIGTGLTATVDMKGASTPSGVVFEGLAAGGYYRAFVTAKGNQGGTAADTTLNSTPATADFDFTDDQDLVTVSSQSVTVEFDDVDFSGEGSLTFGSPSPGGYNQPSAEPSIRVVTPSSDSGNLIDSWDLASPSAITIDSQHNVWVGSGNDTLVRYSSAGSLLGSSTVPAALAGFPDLAADPTTGNVWVGLDMGGIIGQLCVVNSAGSMLGAFAARPLGQGGLAVDPHTGLAWAADPGTLLASTVISQYSVGVALPSLLGTFTVGLSPREIALDATTGDVWVALYGNTGIIPIPNNQVAKLNSAGVLLGSFTVGASPGAIDVDESAGLVWVSTEVAGSVYKLSTAGSVLGSFIIPGLAGGVVRGIAADANHDVWIPGGNSSNVYKLNSAGSLLGSYSVGFATSRVVVDDASHRVWAISTSGTKVLVLQQ
jgi:hypothetical protein